MMEHDISIETFLSKLGSGDPTPGGGAAAALTSALGTSLIMMVTNTSINKGKCGDYEEEITAARDEAAELREHLTECIEEDAKAYKKVAAAYRMPRSIKKFESLKAMTDRLKALETDVDLASHLERLEYAKSVSGETDSLDKLPESLKELLDVGYKDTRRTLVAAASLKASEIPLSVMEDSLKALKLAQDMIGKTYKPLESDLRTAERCLHSGILSSSAIVEANIPAIFSEDSALADKIRKRAEEIVEESGDIVHSYSY